MPIPDVLKLTEAAGYLQVAEETLLALATQGRIPARQLNDEWRFSRRALEAWLFTHGGGEAMFYPYPWVVELDLAGLAVKIRDMVLDELAKSAPQPFAKRSSKEAREKFAGAFKDDPFLEKIVEDAYKERGRPIVEEDE